MNPHTKRIFQFLYLLFYGFAFGLQAQGAGPTLQVREENRDQPDHSIVVESPGHFRLAVLRSTNCGLSQWYDLAHDPNATVNLAHHPTPWNTVNRKREEPDDLDPAHHPGEDHFDQGSLFNQVINPGDACAHIALINYDPRFKDFPHSCKIVESNAVRTICQ